MIIMPNNDLVTLTWRNGRITMTVEDGQKIFLTITESPVKFKDVLEAINDFLKNHGPKKYFNPWFGFIRR